LSALEWLRKRKGSLLSPMAIQPSSASEYEVQRRGRDAARRRPDVEGVRILPGLRLSHES
jgi:hypothetical protein